MVLRKRGVGGCVRIGGVERRETEVGMCCIVEELSVFCQSCFKQMLIGQAGSIGGSTRQKVEVRQ